MNFSTLLSLIKKRKASLTLNLQLNHLKMTLWVKETKLRSLASKVKETQSLKISLSKSREAMCASFKLNKRLRWSRDNLLKWSKFRIRSLKIYLKSNLRKLKKLMYQGVNITGISHHPKLRYLQWRLLRIVCLLLTSHHRLTWASTELMRVIVEQREELLLLQWLRIMEKSVIAEWNNFKMECPNQPNIKTQLIIIQAEQIQCYTLITTPNRWS